MVLKTDQGDLPSNRLRVAVSPDKTVSVEDLGWAGAPSVLASLWSVNDAATARLMADFAFVPNFHTA